MLKWSSKAKDQSYFGLTYWKQSMPHSGLKTEKSAINNMFTNSEGADIKKSDRILSDSKWLDLDQIVWKVK